MTGVDDESQPERDVPHVASLTMRVAAPVSGQSGRGDRLANEKTQDESAYFNALCASSAHAVTVANLDGVAQLWSPGAEQLFGYSADDVVGKSLGILITELDQRLLELPEKMRAGAGAELELRLRHKDGAILDVQASASPVRRGHEVEAMLVLMRDVSPLKTIERRLHSLGQLEALTRVAGGFAHDINNILTIASTYQGFIAEEPLSAAQAADLKVAQDAIERGALLVDRLLALGQNRSIAAVTIDLNEVARTTEQAVRRLLGEGIDLTVRCAAQPVHVRAATGQLDQVLLNLVMNARDAMPNGGKLGIVVRNATVGASHPLLGEVDAGSYAVVSVEDTGTGIDQTTLPHVFEPFFTTKPLGEGTGLGLLIVKDIVSQLRGAVRVQSVIGSGTQFEIFLPLFEAQAYVESVRPPDSDKERKTVLVVDEDEAIRNAMQRILRPLGYSVLLAADGVDATEVSSRHDGPVDLLLCDLHMSREDGRQLLHRLQITRPGLRALFVSGTPMKPGYVEDDARVIRKPFTPEHVASAVKDLLDAETSVAAGPLPAQPVVLVVDDSADVRDLLLRVLSESDLVLLGAKSGLHALQVLEQRHVDLVVADQIMPGMDGVQLLETIRERWPQCQRVLLTAHASSDVVLAAVNRGGVTKVLTKSMHPVSIRDEIESASLTAPRFGGPHSAQKASR
jgi:two-component system, cell cycle sensor histidine kinase and response regulator CckA